MFPKIESVNPRKSSADKQQGPEACFVQFQCVAYKNIRPMLAEVLQYMPLSDRLPAFREHFIPVFDFHGSTLAAKHDLSNEFVATHAIVVHARYEQ